MSVDSRIEVAKKPCMTPRSLIKLPAKGTGMIQAANSKQRLASGIND